MAVSVQSTTDISATVEQVMAVLADVEALPDWASGIKSVHVAEADAEGWPLRVDETISQYGISDEMTLVYEWVAGGASWSLAAPTKLLKRQDASYELTDNGDGTTHVVFDLTVDLATPLPGMIVKRAQKGIAETATKGLKKRVESLY